MKENGWCEFSLDWITDGIEDRKFFFYETKLRYPVGLFRQLKDIDGVTTYRAANFWSDKGDNIIHYISSDSKYYIKHDPLNGRVLFIDVETKTFMGFMLDQENLIKNNYDDLLENLKTIHGISGSKRNIVVKGNTITFADEQANIILGKYKPNETPGISGEIGTDDIIEQLSILKNYSFADKSFELKAGSVHVLNIPDGLIPCSRRLIVCGLLGTSKCFINR